MKRILAASRADEGFIFSQCSCRHWWLFAACVFFAQPNLIAGPDVQTHSARPPFYRLAAMLGMATPVGVNRLQVLGETIGGGLTVFEKKVASLCHGRR
jgi:hypothetical protein